MALQRQVQVRRGAGRLAVWLTALAAAMAGCGNEYALDTSVDGTGNGNNPDIVAQFGDATAPPHDTVVDTKDVDAADQDVEDASTDATAPETDDTTDAEPEDTTEADTQADDDAAEDAADAVDAGTPSDAGCTSDAQCPAGGPCQQAVCDVATGTCGLELMLGCCKNDADCDDGSACTTDACNVQTGNCTITPKTCPSPSPCQKGVCDPGSGECGTEVKEGQCFIAGACVVSGTVHPDDGCLACDPVQNALAWSGQAGVACDDGNACTFSDVCDAQGACTGTALAGCCKKDADCAPANDPCQTAKCNQVMGMCAATVKPGCCTQGTCCDLATNSILPSNAVCSPNPISTEYKCVGLAIQKREIKPGCNGIDAEGCTNLPAFSSPGPWATIENCGVGFACKEQGSGKKPVCEADGSCQGSCDGQAQNGTCWCDGGCKAQGDCCQDFVALCGCSSGTCCDLAASYPKPQGTLCGSTTKVQYQCSGTTIQKRSGKSACNGQNVCSTATTDLVWGAWADSQACPVGQSCQVAVGGASASCVFLPGSCNGICGYQSIDGCYCDQDCKTYGDCCADFDVSGCAGVTQCGEYLYESCAGICQDVAPSGCWCDSLCFDMGDCCGDFGLCGC